MRLKQEFDDALANVEAGKAFLPFVGGEPARIERCAIAAKRCFGIADTAPLDPFEVARDIGVPVIGEREHFNCLPAGLRREVLGSRGRQWSAGTLNGARGPLVVLNPIHAPARLKVTLAEELAHLVMGHPPSTIDAETGMRTYDGGIEAEAFGVGGALVMPYSQLFGFAKRGVPERQIGDSFGVSQELVRYRINRAGLRRMYRKRSA
jgi:hypothetical protein